VEGTWYVLYCISFLTYKGELKTAWILLLVVMVLEVIAVGVSFGLYVAGFSLWTVRSKDNPKTHEVYVLGGIASWLLMRTYLLLENVRGSEGKETGVQEV
jgi:hypothetical protein